MDVNERISELIKHSVQQIADSPRLKNELEYLSVQIGNKVACASCGGERKKAYNALKKFYNSGRRVQVSITIEEKKMSQFSLKGLTYFHELGEHFSNKNLTDEKAILILKGNRKRITHFDKYPENWESLLNGNVIQIEEKVEELIVEELTEPKKPGRPKKERSE